MVFGLWGKKATKLVDELDEVYMTRALADAALVRAAAESKLPVVVASFFSESLERIQRAWTHSARGASLPQRITADRWPSAATAADGPWLLDASQLTPSANFEAKLSAASGPFLFLFVEHFPRWSTESAVLAVLEKGSALHAQRVRFFMGLDEPLMRAFDGDKVTKLMRTLGMTETEKVSHSMIDKSIINAQKKLDARVSTNFPAHSDSEWFLLNLAR
jgi:hypothetical protein